LVGSVHFWEKALPVVVYDIGLTPQERSEVRGWHGVALRTLPWSRHPPHVRDLFKYAWKPLAIADALSRCQGDTIMLYQDAGQELRQPLAELLRTVPIQGHLFPAAGVPAITATHPATLAFLNTSAEELDRGSVQMALGGNLAMVCGSKGTKAHTVIEAAVACALEEKCIAPPGASTSTHAFDQAVWQHSTPSAQHLCPRCSTPVLLAFCHCMISAPMSLPCERLFPLCGQCSPSHHAAVGL